MIAETVDVEVTLLLVALRERWGYDFTGYAPAALRRRLTQLCSLHGAARIADLLVPVLDDEAVANSVIRGISVPVSAFFRDPPVWRCVREVIAVQLESFPRINIWQAGCGRGEETYTLAMILRETGLASRARLIASDINPDLLEAARQGRWHRREVDQWRDNYLASGGTRDFDSYFMPCGDDVVVDELIRSSVEFVHHNLVADDVFLEAQLVVCRNVLIYFGEALQERVLDLFRRSLQRGGYLLLGPSESALELMGKLSAFEPVQDASRIYRKPVRRQLCQA